MLRRAPLVFAVALAPVATSCASFSVGSCLTSSCGCCSQCLYDFRDPIDGTCGCCLNPAAKPFAPGAAAVSTREDLAVTQANADGAMPY